MNESLSQRTLSTRSIPAYTENVEITTKTNTVKITSTYRYGHADNYRNNFAYLEKKKCVEKEMLYLLNMMNIKYDAKDIESSFIENSVQKIEDDVTENKVIIESIFILKNIYTSDTKEVLMCYPQDLAKLTWDRRDLPYYFSLNSFKRTIIIKTERPIAMKDQKVTTRNIDIDNKYFSFTNHKKFKNREVKIETVFFVKKI